MGSSLRKGIYIIKLLPKLGYFNIFYALWYKISSRFSLRKWKFPIRELPTSSFYKETSFKTTDYYKEWKDPLFREAGQILNHVFTYFSFHKSTLEKIPDWFYDPFNRLSHPQPHSHWTTIKNFSGQDIKLIWELSRFDWLSTLARAYKVSLNDKYLERLNELLADWSQKNPLNQGPNWMCGQEASIRVMKLLTTAEILDQLLSPSDSLKKLVRAHLERIESNITYAIIQDNNHGTSEAAALYIGSAWLEKCGYNNDNVSSNKKKGRKLLINRILKLVQPDGTFSQRSTNYHRVFIDTMSFTLHFMRLLGEPPFEGKVLDRLIKAGEWQYKLTFGKMGDVPNFGSNDGAMLENLHSCEYRDFRVSTQCFFSLLTQQRLYDDITISESMYWRCGPKGLQYPLLSIPLAKYEILDQQILIARKNNTQLFLKIPEDSFRPGNDAFHIDFWINGAPAFLDTGTFSYNHATSKYYKSVTAHNTVQFNNHEQMPEISRFLNGEWIKPDHIGEIHEEGNKIEWEGSFTDYKGNIHHRKFILSDQELVIIDRLKSSENPTIRFHVSSEDFTDLIEIKNGEKINIKSSHSMHYMNSDNHPCIEITPTTGTDGDFITSFKYNTTI